MASKKAQKTGFFSDFPQPQMRFSGTRLQSSQKTVGDIVLYAPESFEWILLSTNMIPNARVSQILEQPENYIDSREYVSWERFFTAVLVSQTQDDPLWAYSKKKLPEIYLSSKIINAVKSQMKLIAWDENKAL